MHIAKNSYESLIIINATNREKFYKNAKKNRSMAFNLSDNVTVPGVWLRFERHPDLYKIP